MPLITNVEDLYAWLFRSLDVVVRKYGTFLVGMLTEVKEKNQVRLEFDVEFDQLMLMATNTYFQVSAENM